MAATPPKKRKGKIFLIGFLTFFCLLVAALYLVVTSPRFLDAVLRRVNQVISGKIVYESLNLNLPDQRFSAKNLQYQNAEGKTAFSVDSLEVHFELISALRGRIHLRNLQAQGVRVNFANFPERKGISQWRKVLQIILQRMAIFKSKLTPIDLTLKDGRQIHLENLEIYVTKQILQNQRGQVKIGKGEFDLKGKKITTGPLIFSGEMGIPILREYDYFVEKADGFLKIQDIQFPDIPAVSLNTKFRIRGNKLSLKNGELQTLQGILNLDLDYNHKKSALALHLRNDKPISFEIIPHVSEHLKETFSGFKLDMDADLTGSNLENVGGKIELALEALGNRTNDHTPDYNLTLKGKLKKGVLSLDKFKIGSDKMRLEATGSIDFPHQNLNTKITADNFDVTTQVNTITDLDITGTAGVKGTITGNFKSPNFYVEADAEDAGYSFMNFGKVKGVFKIENGDLSFKGGSPPGSESTTQVEVLSKNIFKPERHTTLKASYQNLDASALLTNPQIQGKVSGSFGMESTGPNHTTGTLKAKIEDFVLYQFHFDEINAEGKLENKRFTLQPVTFAPAGFDVLTIPSPVVFNFGDKGWTVEGTLQKGISLSGKFLESQPDHVLLDTKLQNAKLEPIMAALLISPEESYADGEIKMSIGLEEKPTEINLHLDKLRLLLESGEVSNDGPLEVLVKTPRVDFKNFKLQSGGRNFAVRGTYTLDGPIALAVNGKLDLGLLELLPKYFRDGSGFANMDLKISGTYENPRLVGNLTFEEAGVTLRPIRGEIENLNGSLRLTGNSIVFDNLQGTMREGDIAVKGEVQLKNFTPTFYDLLIETREVAISQPGVYKIIFSGDFTLKGPVGKALLSGTMDISDGVYSRDFSITQFLIKPQIAELPEQPSPFLKDIQLALNIRSPGELAIKNNIATIYFNSDLKVTGPATNPLVSGALEVLDGKLHYFTIDFTSAHGTIDFRDPKRGAYVSIDAEKNFEQAFSTATVVAHIEGYTNNLKLTFSSNPPMDRQNIMKLVFTGSIPGTTRAFNSGQLATTILASQLSQVIQRPLARSAHLDIFRLEASDPERSTAISRLVIGKRLTDRLSLDFKTDIGVDTPLQGVEMEYLLLDNVLLKGTQFSNGEFSFNLAWRFQLN